MAYTAGTVIDSSLKTGGSAKLTGSGGEVLDTCSNGTVKGKTSVTSATSLNGIISSIIWEGCSTTTDTVANGELSISWTSGNNGTVTGAGSQVTVSIFGVSCTYGTGTGTHLGTLTGGEAPVLSISTTVTKTAGGFLCPGTAGWDAEYVITEPHALFVTQ